MENKRKAAGANEAGPTDGEDRAVKRRKQHQSPPLPQQFDLLKGESPESTTAYGLIFLEQIRKTADKNGRPVARYFEELLPEKKNEDYYKKIQMPISLATIEEKLNNREFSTLAELESYFKRMVTNAKEYYNRGSQVYDDSERVRKALSNYMVKTNPAYKLIPGYSCQPTPLPPESEARSGEPEGNEGEGDTDGGEDDDEDDDDEDDIDDDSDAGPTGRRNSRRSQRSSVQKVPERVAGGKAKPDHEYEGVSYKRLSFQQAQEKIVEEMIREEDEDEPGWMKFEAFLNLPPRSLKEYFSIITDPISLRALQKLVKGIHGRQPATGVSDFKGWAAFEEKTSLLWSNAHYFNEEGSSIYNLATELKEFFEGQLKKAKAAVPEPPQPKIKLKVAPSQESPAPPGPKKIITIHVGGSRGSTAASPAPAAGSSANSNPPPPEMSQNGGPVQQNLPPASSGGPPAAMNMGHPETAGSMSASVVSPSPSLAGVKQEQLTRQSPAMAPRTNGTPAHPAQAPNGAAIPAQAMSALTIPAQAVPAQAVPQHQPSMPAPNSIQRIPPAPPNRVYDKDYRVPGKDLADALIKNLLIRGHPAVPVDTRFKFELPAQHFLGHQTVTTFVPSNQSKLQIILTIAPLERQERHYRLYVMVNGITLPRSVHIPIPGDDLEITADTLTVDATLHPGINWIEVHLIAALPKGQSLPEGEECELEKWRVIAQLLR